MGRFAHYVWRNFWRHKTRGLLTVSGAAVALFVFTFVGAVQEGLGQLMHGIQADRTLIVFQANRFCPSTSRLPEDYARTIAALPGVKDAVPIKVFMNNCRASLDLVVFHGLPAEKLSTIRDLHLIAGNQADFEKRRDAALVGRALAGRRRLQVGQKFSIGPVTVTVAGIFTSPQPAEENFLYTHLEFLQRIPGLYSVGTATQLEVLLTDQADPDSVARAIDTRFRGGPIPTDTRTKGVFQANAIGDLVDLIGATHYLGYACIVLVLALVAMTTVMAVQDRTRVHAVLQTLGFSWVRILGLVLAESVLVSLIGGSVGVAGAMIFLVVHPLAIGTEGVTIAFAATTSLALYGMLVTTMVGIMAGLIPAWMASRADIVSSLRAI